MRVALVHDWLTGMRGGEKVLEALCELYPDADIFTLFHQRGIRVAADRAASHSHLVLQRLPLASRHYGGTCRSFRRPSSSSISAGTSS